ncbi:MAG: pyruvate dehydrogenase (acetyl-transferring) E1 component subunit alpha [Oceanospirillaceae bacterium]|nr:pyruvate dehydrogenase (acetyl-transferring) E1 component subunit alpha [Oceanospirillaceae bacterium]
MTNIAYQGEIRFSRYLDAAGQPVTELPGWAESPEILVEYYRQMTLARQFDTKAIALQRTGQLGTYPSLLGSEAIDIPTASLMHGEDVLIPYYRNHAMQVMRGSDWRDVLLYWGGDERGSANPAQRQDLPNCVPIATQCLHACGVATAFRIRGEKRVAVTLCGDGATSKGDFLEALNVAGTWQLPLVFIVNNNQWAISVPRAMQCGAPTLAQKAIGAGIRGEQVDGNDVIAVHEAVALALERARGGKGPSLIEAISYRLSDHTTADDATRYRSGDELKAGWEQEPVKRLRNYLHGRGWWNEDLEQAWQTEVSKRIQQAVDDYLATPVDDPGAMFDHLYAELPPQLVAQRERVCARAETRRQQRQG